MIFALSLKGTVKNLGLAITTWNLQWNYKVLSDCMEINLHVCLPELGLTASLTMLCLCERSADLDRFRPSSSFSDWQ